MEIDEDIDFGEGKIKKFKDDNVQLNKKLWNCLRTQRKRAYKMVIT